ncbi:MAG: alpha/beta hydrolase, partial [Proteobacteria bacterium]|nr:alpha/beta hydrolase [Pseudomonadota bacterium]
LDGYALMQALSFKKFSIFGHCNGGVSAIILAVLHPESVQKLIIWGSTAYVTKDDIELWENTRDTSYWNQQLRAAMQNAYGDSFESLWFKYIDTVKDIYEKRKDGDLCMEEVKRVQCPTLIVHGDCVLNFMPTISRRTSGGARWSF